MTNSTTAPDLSHLIGTPFRAGGRRPGQGLDCAGVVIEALRAMGVPPPLALSAPASAAGGTAPRDGWRFIGTDLALAQPAGRVLVGSGPRYGVEHVWVSLGDGTVATANERSGFRVLSIGSIADEVRAVYGFERPADPHRRHAPAAPPAPPSR